MTPKGFLSVTKAIKDSFPRSKPWVEWWERPNHVNMLVVPDGDIRSAVPSSTNAQEAAHAAMYTKHGKYHELLTGLEKPLLISKEFERPWMLESVGALGEGRTDLERRQEMQEKYGQTKKGRMKAAIEEREKHRQLPLSDSRPPDTVRALLSHSGQKQNEPSKDAKESNAPEILWIVVAWASSQLYQNEQHGWLVLRGGKKSSNVAPQGLAYD
ncbi:hypothetical protein AAF712_015282 [Marasmius tenuissimus]|uniref:Uncharacterized protein n=1 Tax=Marasmius tenuissimus TaxID=585030 RepID=A0ABR2Z9V5_9AGAR